MIVIINQDLSSITSKRFFVDNEIANLIPSSLARQYRLFPFKKEGETLFIVIEDPYDFIAIDHLKRITGLEIVPSQGTHEVIHHNINKLYGNEPMEKAVEDFNKVSQILEPENNWSISSSDSIASAPIVRLVDSIIQQAIEQRSSDIHIEPMDETLRIRFRIDGVLQTINTLPLKIHNAVVARIKILGNMNITEKRTPQDGRSEVQSMGRSIDIRISAIPTVNGEKLVLRLLDRDYFLFPKEALGFSKYNLKMFNDFLKLSHGIVLITGPTGSGKSTTLYTMLNEINNDGDNIITVEDPVECKIAGINQIQIESKGGMTFPTSLRSVLRQDPDIIMIGEIRDYETAELAIRAAITGHLVFSTVHTHNAVGAIMRLLDMGVKDFLLADALMGVISQRLIRKLCPYCSKPYNPSKQDLDRIGVTYHQGRTWSDKSGCIKCNYTGYKGRTAIHEVLKVDSGIRNRIIQRSSVEDITSYAIKNGLRPLKEEGIDYLEAGYTSLEEIRHLLDIF